MEFDVLDALDDLAISVSSLNIVPNAQRCFMPNEDDKNACLRYSGMLKSDDEVKEAIEKGTKSLEFTKLVEWLSKELQSLNNMESCVNALTDLEDSSSFLLEVSSFLKELHCPYKSLTSGPISQRLLDVQSRRTLLDFLCTELLAARMLHTKKDTKNAMEIEVYDSSTALSLRDCMETLNIKVDDFISDPIKGFSTIENKVKKVLDTKPECLPPPIITDTFSEEQLQSLQSLYEDFLAEYTVRRELLLTRLDVTIQSFKWGEGSKGKENKILEAYMPRRKKLATKPAVKLSDVLAARESLLIVEKTSSGSQVENTKSSINKVLIAAVPDRGGRPKEQRPPVEMPNWMKRNAQGGGGRGDQHRGGGSWQNRGKKFRGNQGGGGDRGQKKDYYRDKGYGHGKKSHSYREERRRH